MRGFAPITNREIKAKKIEAVLGDFINKKNIEGFKILDIGSGSGHICSYFADKNEVFAVDIEEQMVIKDKERIRFKKVDSELLPFEDDFFDIVLSNQVIEHMFKQKTHLQEVYRVLKKNGICYLATPNRIFPFEPHYKLLIIHYLPKKLFFGILKISKKYKEDLFLLWYSGMIKLIRNSGFVFTEYTMEIINKPGEYFGEFKIPFTLPRIFKYFSPTNVFVLNKAKEEMSKTKV